MKRVCYVLLFFIVFNAKAQLLFYQNTFRGGVTSDGRSYKALNYLQRDTIDFSLHFPLTYTLKRAFLFSVGVLAYTNKINSKDSPLLLSLNNRALIIDSSDRVTNYFYDNLLGQNIWMIAKDVTSLIQPANNRLIVPNQNDTIRYRVYGGFLLVVLYENNTMASVNTAIFINNNNYANNMLFSIKKMNPVNTNNDVGLSVYMTAPDIDSTSFYIGGFYLGATGVNYVRQCFIKCVN